MAKTLLQIIEDEIVIGDQVITVHSGHITRASPKDGSGPEYIRMHLPEGNYKWNAPVADWNEDVTEDDPRWIAE